MFAAAASFWPQASSTVTTAARARSGVNSRALVWKYSSMVPCRSRWSWVRFVNPATSNTTASTRWKAHGVRGNLHGRRIEPALPHEREQGVHVRGFGGGEQAGDRLAAGQDLDGPDQPGPFAQRPQQGIDEVGGGGLAVRACHPEQGGRPGAVGPALVDQRRQPADHAARLLRRAARGRGCRWRAPAGAHRRRPSGRRRHRRRRPGRRSRPRAAWRPAGRRRGLPGGPPGSSGRSR